VGELHDPAPPPLLPLYGAWIAVDDRHLLPPAGESHGAVEPDRSRSHDDGAHSVLQLLSFASNATADVFDTLMVTSKSVKKPYSSTLRAVQAQATRRAIVDAAATLFVERGYGGTSIDAIAEAAGVSRKTVFTAVGGKLETLKLALDWAISGDDEPIPVLDRPHVRSALQEPDARRVLRDFATNILEVMSRTAALVRVLESAAGLDADLRALNDDLRAQRQQGMSYLAALLHERGALRPDLTVEEAADVLWLFTDSAPYHRLVVEQGWSAERYEAWLAEGLLSLLVARGYRPEPGAPRRGSSAASRVRR
jgi:AcrR family transcriptional regulator